VELAVSFVCGACPAADDAEFAIPQIRKTSSRLLKIAVKMMRWRLK
jgi:hypothetical protein